MFSIYNVQNTIWTEYDQMRSTVVITTSLNKIEVD